MTLEQAVSFIPRCEYGIQCAEVHEGNPSLGNFALFPYPSCVNDTVDGCAYPKLERALPFDNSSLKASPGYFSLTLENGVNAAMTVSQHTSLFQFTFPSSNSGSPLILLDLTDLSNSRQDNASIAVDGASGRMTGNGRFQPSFGSGTYVAYFCVDFKGSDVRDNGIFVNSRASADVKNLTISRGINSGALPGGAFVRFQDSSPVLARVGLSYISSDQACSLAEDEIPSFDFNATYSAAMSAWRAKLSPISVSTYGVNTSVLKNFYSGIYRTMVNPQNYTGVNPLVSADEIWFDSFYWYNDSPH
jgi:putative alpha-1,2-mannosidase